MNPITDPYILKPVLKDGKPWVQRFFVCSKLVYFIKVFSKPYIRVGELVRHAKCRPEALR